MGGHCPSCVNLGYRHRLSGVLYILQDKNDLVKIGITNRTAEERCEQINKAGNRCFEVKYFIKFSDGKIAHMLEQKVLKILRGLYKNPPEKFSGSTETFINLKVSELIKIITETYILLQRKLQSHGV